MYESVPSVRIAFAAYIAVTFLLAYLARRQATGGGFLREFLVGGRTIGPWVLGLTWIATAASGGTFIGAPALAHANGWSVMLWISGYIVVATTGFGLLGRRIAELGVRTGALTFPDLLRDRFGSRAIGAVSGVAMLVLHTSFIVAQYIAGARVLEAVMGVPYNWGVAGFAVVVALYTAYGGFRAVAWTDSFQAVVMLLGVLITAGFGLHKVGGMQAVFDGLAAQSPDLLTPTGPEDFLPLPAAISFFFVWPMATAGQPSLITRFLASRDTTSLRRAALIIGCYILLLYPAVIFVGIMGRVLVPRAGCERPRDAGDDPGRRSVGTGRTRGWRRRWRRSCRRSAPFCWWRPGRWRGTCTSAIPAVRCRSSRPGPQRTWRSWAWASWRRHSRCGRPTTCSTSWCSRARGWRPRSCCRRCSASTGPE